MECLPIVMALLPDDIPRDAALLSAEHELTEELGAVSNRGAPHSVVVVAPAACDAALGALVRALHR